MERESICACRLCRRASRVQSVTGITFLFAFVPGLTELLLHCSGCRWGAACAHAILRSAAEPREESFRLLFAGARASLSGRPLIERSHSGGSRSGTELTQVRMAHAPFCFLFTRTLVPAHFQFCGNQGYRCIIHSTLLIISLVCSDVLIQATN